MSTLADRQQRLAAVQANNARLRQQAFVRYRSVVCGHALEPITLESWNRLHALGSAFVTGAAITPEDVAVFVWLHHRDFGQFSPQRGPVLRSVISALRTRFAGLNSTLIFLLPLLPRSRLWSPLRWLCRACIRRTPGEKLGEAALEIRRLLHEATFDIPGGDSDGPPLQFASQAQMLNLFRVRLGMSFDETRSLPMRELNEHFRELIYVSSNGKALLDTPEEAAIWVEHMEAVERDIAPTAAARRN